MQRIFAADPDGTSNKDQDRTLRIAGLHIGRLYLMFHLTDLSQFAHNVLRTLELLTFESHHTVGLLEGSLF
jgi:hypothetical protein